MGLSHEFSDNMWEINVCNQFLTFVYSLILGGLLCFSYDFIRAIRKSGFNYFIAVFFTDIIFWIISAFVTFIFLISRTNGEIRGYVIFGELVGFILFRITISKFIFYFFTVIFKLIIKCHSKIVIIFDAIYKKTADIFSKIWALMVKFLKSALKSIKKLLKIRHKVLYTNKNNADAEYVLNETKT